MPDQAKDSGIVTFVSTIGFVFGIIGMLGSFIPVIGGLAFYVGIPASAISGIGLVIAKSTNSKHNFAVAALTVCLIGIAVSGYQYFSIVSYGEKTVKAFQQQLNQGSMQKPEQDSEPYSVKIIDPKTGE